MDELTIFAELRRDLKRDFRDAEMSKAEARYIVDVYYQLQDFRIQAASQLRSEGNEPRRWAETLLRAFELLERDVQSVLGAWARRTVPGRWAQSITGIGPVISAGLVAHIEIVTPPHTRLGRKVNGKPGAVEAIPERITTTAGQIWRFAGLDPTARWEKGQVRPHNADLKVLCWKLGDSFVKQSGRDSDIYGHVYRARKELEIARNDALMFADQAAHALETRQIKDAGLRACYESGRLPDGRIDLRARRYAVKLFLAHFHHVAWWAQFGTEPEKPFIFTDRAKEMGLDGHNGFIGPPNWPMDDSPNGARAATDVRTAPIERHMSIMHAKAAKLVDRAHPRPKDNPRSRRRQRIEDNRSHSEHREERE